MRAKEFPNDYSPKASYSQFQTSFSDKSAMNLPRLSQSPRDPAFIQNPYPFYGQLHGAGGTIWWDEYEMLVFGRIAVVNAALRDRRFGRTPLTSVTPPTRLAAFYDYEARSMLELEGAAHRKLRSLVTRAFVSRRIDGMRPRIEALAHRLLDKFEPTGGGDLLQAYCEPIPVIVIAELLGLPSGMAPDLLRWSHAMVAMYQFGRDRAAEDAAEAATKAFSAYLAEEVAQRRAAPRDDLLTLLTQADERGEALAGPDIVTTAILLLNAGHEATVHALGNGVKALLETDLRPDGTDEVGEEILRYDPPLHMFTRYVYENMIFANTPLKRGQVVGLSLGAATRDPARFEAADTFLPDRPDAGHVSFGAGAHFCLGAALARLEMRVALPILFERLPKLRLKGTPRYADRYHFRGLEALEVGWGK